MRRQTLTRYNDILRPLNEEPLQTYLGTKCHQLGLLSWILSQTGPANVIVTTFSTSDDFLCGFIRLREDGFIRHSTLLADFKASKKTLKIGNLMLSAFDDVRFGENHSKLMLVDNGTMKVAVITSQNQTYGGRNESTFITTSLKVYFNLYEQLMDIITNKSTPYKVWKTLK